MEATPLACAHTAPRANSYPGKPHMPTRQWGPEDKDQVSLIPVS